MESMQQLNLPNKVKAILFDKDDTIIELETFWRIPIKKTAEYLSKIVLRKIDIQLIKELEKAAGFSDGKLLAESPVVAGTNTDIINMWEQILAKRNIFMSVKLKEDVNVYLEFACREFGEIKPITDFHKLLGALEKSGLRIGIATSDNYNPTMHCLKKLGIDSYFDAVFSADTVENPKPYTDISDKFCSMYRLKHSEVAMVGDSANDMMFAKNSGMVGVFYHPDGVNVILPEGAEYCVTDLQQIL